MSPTISRLFNLVERASASFVQQNIYGKRNIIVMCSGGVDSVAALHYFSKQNTSNYRVNGYHFNHKLRPQNEEMVRKVELLCDSLNVPLLKGVADRELKTEADCRRARLDNIKQFRNSIAITGHHLNDCVESYLLNCFRGHANYLPIPFYTQLDQNKDVFISHPFLLVTKEKLKQYCIKQNLMQYVEEDETNASTEGSRRNLIRNKIVPILEQEHLGLEKVVKKIIEKRLLLELLKQ